MLSSSIYPLANPKGVKLECELCQKTAHVMCPQCRVTFYCDVTHQAADWNGIHEKICQLLIPVRTPLPFLSSTKEREHSKEQLVQRQKHLIDLTRTVAQKLLFEGKHEEAIPGALQSLRFAIAVYGSLSAELVPSQLLLAEASIGLGRLDEAEEYLSQAQWTMMKTTECINAIQYKLYRNLGLLYTAKCEFDKALWYFADDIYHATRVFSVSDIHTAGGYYHMANVFYKQEKMDIADSLYSEVTDIWKNFLGELVEMEIQKSLWKAGISSPEPGTSLVDLEDVFDESQEAEAVKVLHAIFDMRNQELLVKNGKIGNIAHTLAMLYYLFLDFNKAVEYGDLALEDNELFAHNKKEIATIQRLLEMAKKALSYPGGKGPSAYNWANSC
ncbi:zinc finger MYND domain-containing protein 12 [Pristis pectinata]|uniref:zinc finger MYND domain-containing protein 12 n=1 Tax=Pristis pectinata TaxID=685728 RepID=UPI00223CBF26|nr:zinc finger MYND domain-containing protein 12 [Pristis pectinata]